MEKLTQKEAAKKNQVSPGLVSRIVRKATTDEEYLSRYRWTEHEQSLKVKEVIRETEKMLGDKCMIKRAADIVSWFHFYKQIKVSEKLVRDVFKKDFGLRYYEVKKNSYQSNSERNLVLRQ